MLKYVSLFVVLCTAFWAFGQTPPYIHYKIENGLPSNTVYDVYKDKKGFLWFCTDKGVSRYNGIDFEHFTSFNGLPDNEIFFCKEDRESRIWFATYNGALCYYKDGVFHNERNTPFLKYPLKEKSFIHTIDFSDDGTVIIQHIDRKNVIFIRNEKLEVLSLDKAIKSGPPEVIMFLRYLSPDRHYLYFRRFYLVLDGLGNPLSRIYYQDTSLHDWSFSREKDIFLLTKNKIIPLDGKPVTLKKPLTDLDNVLRIAHLSPYYFLCSQGGLLLVNNGRQLFRNIQVTGIVADQFDNYWISTLEDGAYKFPADFGFFRAYKGSYQNTVSLAKIIGGKLFFATSDGSLYGAIGDSIARFYHHKADGPGSQYEPKTQKRLAIDEGLGYLLYSEKGSISIPGILEGNFRPSQFSMPPLVRLRALYFSKGFLYAILPGIVRCMGYDRPGNKANQGLDIVSGDMHNKRILSQVFDQGQSLWVSTADGMYRVRDGKAVLQPQYKSVFREFDFCGGTIIGYTEQNHLLISNVQDGIVYTDTVDDQQCLWEHIYPIDSTHTIIGTDDYYRLLTITPSKGKPVYNISILENTYLPQRAEFILADSGYCYFFKNGNVVRYTTSKLWKSLKPPDILFTVAHTGGKDSSVGKTLQVSYERSKKTSIKFKPISYNSQDLEYEYSVTDQEKTENWSRTTSDEINLYAIGYGTHWLKVRVKSKGSSYSVPAVLKLIIDKPLWATWWFILCVSVAFMGIVGLVILLLTRRILRRRQKQYDSEIKYQRSEYKALNALMNPHFIFNSLNNIQGLINENNKQAANEYLIVFSQLVRQNMHNVSKELIPLEKEIALITNYLNLEKLRFKDNLNFSIHIEEDVETDQILIPPLLIQPLVENAIKHGLLPRESPDSILNLRLYERNDVLFIEIEDNGVGISYSREHKNVLHDSFSTDNIRKRIEYLKGIHDRDFSFSIEEKVNEEGRVEGTIATISIGLETDQLS
jgi:two-component sensor histidine kinase